MLNKFKMSSLRCELHVQEIMLPKNMFTCPLNLILKFFEFFCIFDYKSKYSYIIMYTYENSPPPQELS